MRLLIAILGCAACALLWRLYPQRFDPSDPWVYSHNAWEISRSLGDFLADAPNHPFAHRLAVTVPVALSYALFGVSVWATNLWPLLSVFAVVVALCAVLRTHGERALAVFLCATCVGVLRQSVALYSDVIAMGLLFSAAAVLSRRGGRAAPGEALAAVSFALLTFAAFLAKETAYWILPVWLYALASDLRAGDRATARRFHLTALATFAALGAAYLLFCARVWGDPLARLASVRELTGHHLWSWQDATAWDWFKRLVLAPPKLLLADFGPAVLLALLAVFTARPRDAGKRDRRFWLVYTGTMLGLFWFGSTAFTRYEPLPALPRMVLPAIPGFFVLAAGLAPRLRGPGASGWIRAACAASVVPLLAYALTWDFSPDPRERAARVVKTEIAKNRRVLLLTADVRSPGHFAFYFGYRFPGNLRVLDLEGLVRGREPLARADSDTAFVFSNAALSSTLLRNVGNENFEPRLAKMELPRVFGQGDASLYVARDPETLVASLRAAR